MASSPSLLVIVYPKKHISLILIFLFQKDLRLLSISEQKNRIKTLIFIQSSIKEASWITRFSA